MTRSAGNGRRFRAACRLACAGLVALPCVSAAAVAHAQDSPPRGLAPVIVERADPAGELRGHLLELGPETMTLLVEGRRLDVPLFQVLRVDSGHDPVRNGALIGAIVGGVWCAVVCGQALENGGAMAAAVAINAVFLGGVGAAIDAMIPGRNTIYRRSPQQASARPVLSYRVRF